MLSQQTANLSGQEMLIQQAEDFLEEFKEVCNTREQKAFAE